MANKVELTDIEKKNLRSLFWRSGHMWADFTMVRMEGNTYAFSMLPVINEVYAGNEELQTEAFVRNTEFFNTHAAAAGLVFGLSYALERERSKNPELVTGEMITNVKTSLMGPLAAVGDSIFFNCIRVIAAGVGISLASKGNPIGVLLFVAIYGLAFLGVKWWLINLGYTLGTKSIAEAFKSGIIGNLSKAACAMGLMMVGSLTSSMIDISTKLVIPMGSGTEMVVQDIFDAIFPGILKLALLYFCVTMTRKKVQPIVLIGIILAFGIVGALVGLF